MATSVAAVLAVLLLAGLSFPVLAGAPSPNPGATLELGYGASALSPASEGIPVYTVGDQLWVSSGYSASVRFSVRARINQSVNVLLNESASLTPGVPQRLHTFTGEDQEGTHSLAVEFADQSGFAITGVTIGIKFVKLDNHPVILRPDSNVLHDATITSSFTAEVSDAYNIQACASSQTSTEGVLIPFPSSIGNGSLLVRRNGDAVRLSQAGNLSSPFTFWMEVYHPYSYSVSGGNQLVSRDVRSAASIPVLIQPPGSVNTTITYDTHLRQGRATMRAFFDNPRGLVVTEAPLLVLDNSSWLEFGKGCPPFDVLSGSLAAVTDLAARPETWATRLCLVYRVSGVEGLSTVPLRLNVSRVTFNAIPWNRTLTDGLTATVGNVTDLSNIEQMSYYQGSAFIVSRHYPAVAMLDSDFFGRSGSIAVVFTVPYTSQSVSLPAALLSVRVLSGDTPAAGARVIVVNKDTNVNVTLSTGSGGTSSIAAPPGHYVVTASLSNQSQTRDATLTQGLETSIAIGLATPGAESSLVLYVEVALAVAAAVGVTANLLYLFFRRGSRTSTRAR